MDFSVADIVAATKGKLLQGLADLKFTRVSTDSRSLKKGDFYIPLKGPKFDGHDFISDAFSKGAGGCLTAREWEAERVKESCVIRVEDTLKALGEMASAWRKRFEIPIVAVTGSSGKTATKEMIAAALSAAGPVCKTRGNLNNLVGLPLSLFETDATHCFGVFEIGMNAFGEISRLTEILQPTIGLITNVGPAHLEGVGDLEGVARAKGELFVGLSRSATALINLDDPLVASLPTRGKRLTFGTSPQAAIRSLGVKFQGGKMEVTIADPGGKNEFTLSVAGEHHAKNWLAAYAVCYAAGVSPDEAQRGIESFKLEKGRGEILTFNRDLVVMDDSYNANPDSMKAAFSTFAIHFPRRRRVGILGEMLELGTKPPYWHEETGKTAADSGLELLIAFGDHADDMVRGYRSRKKSAPAVAFPEMTQLTENLPRLLKDGDALLIKGSRGTAMERVIEFLKKTL